MVSLTPEVEYPIEPFEWGLLALQICCFWLLHDQRYIDFQTGHFANFEQFKIYSHFTDFGQFKIVLIYNLGRSQLFYQVWARC